MSAVTLSGAAVDSGPFTVDAAEASIIAAEARAAAAVLGDTERAQARQLADVVGDAIVPDELLGILARVATASLQGGRARRLYLAEGEKVLNGVLSRTPRGREASRGIDEVNRALGAFAGKSIGSVHVAQRAPGNLTLSLSTTDVGITLEFSSGTVTVKSVSL